MTDEDPRRPVGHARRRDARRARGSGPWIAAAAMLAPAIVAGADVDARFEAGRLSVRTEGAVAARRVFASIGERTGVEFVLDPAVADRPLRADLEGVPLERALDRLLAELGGVGGRTLVYEPLDGGGVRLVRVLLYGPGRSQPVGETSPPDDALRGAAPTPPAVAIEAPTPSAADWADEERRLVERGVPPETAREFVEINDEAVRAERTPGAAEAIMRSERYRRINRDMARAQGKFGPEVSETPAR